MKSYVNLLKIGPGPSSSHTLGPQKAALRFKEEHPAAYYEVDLLGSLSLTGKGHLTDYIIYETLKPTPTLVRFTSDSDEFHPNAMEFYAFDEHHQLLTSERYYSIGGGTIVKKGESVGTEVDVYPHHSFAEIEQYINNNQLSIIEYIDYFDPHQEHLEAIFDAMMNTVEIGLQQEGVLPGKLKLQRVAKQLNEKAHSANTTELKSKLKVMSYAYAASEQNASGGICVTAPTLGASGILPALLYMFYYDDYIERQRLIDGLKVASLFGNLIKQNATISGAEGGCQAEVGAAIAMGSAMVTYIQGGSLQEMEYAAEMGIEHHLGLTCDPVGGYVMIPCIERNVVGALRCLDNALLSQYLSPIRENKVSFDMVVNTMNYTGKKICVTLKETSLGGLATEVPFDDSESE